MSEFKSEKEDVRFEQALAAARREGSCMLYGSESQGLRALVYPDARGGARMCMYEAELLLMAFTATEVAGSPFEPSRDIARPQGSLCDAIEASASIPPGKKMDRIWQTWVEMFEGLPLLASGAESSVEVSRLASRRSA